MLNKRSWPWFWDQQVEIGTFILHLHIENGWVGSKRDVKSLWDPFADLNIDVNNNNDHRHLLFLHLINHLPSFYFLSVFLLCRSSIFTFFLIVTIDSCRFTACPSGYFGIFRLLPVVTAILSRMRMTPQFCPMIRHFIR
jgi:hypothetical protein